MHSIISSALRHSCKAAIAALIGVVAMSGMPYDGIDAECNNFKHSFGYDLTQEATPEIFKLIAILRQHTDVSWATALILAEINPDNSREILARGYALSSPPNGDENLERREMSDSQRLSARSIVERLENDDAFSRQLSKAKTEFSAIKKATQPAVVGTFQNRN